jgi:hypothetical protein
MFLNRLALALAFAQFFVTPNYACLPIATRDASNTTTFANTTINEDVQIRIVARPPPSKTAILNVRIFDGYQVQPPRTLYWDDDTIIEYAAEVDTIIDGRNGILLPGLIDSHCHTTLISHLDALSSYGVTTALGMSCEEYATCDTLRDQVGLTAFFTAGHAAVGPGSNHTKSQNLPPSKLISSVSEAPTWVENVFNNGRDYLKITVEENGPDQNLQNALVLYSHAMGRKAMTHAAEMEYYAQAIVSKSDGPQHMPYDQLLNDSMLDLMVTQKQFATPTVNLYQLRSDRPEPLQREHGIRKKDHDQHQAQRDGIHDQSQSPLQQLEVSHDDRQQRYGYLHTYRIKKSLRLLYLDGQSAAKSIKGTMDTQDIVLRNASWFFGSPIEGDNVRGNELCSIAKECWNGRIDGFLRMVGGFEIILCSFDADLVMINIAAKEPEREGHPETSLSHAQALATRCNGIGGDRVAIHYGSLVSVSLFQRRFTLTKVVSHGFPMTHRSLALFGHMSTPLPAERLPTFPTASIGKP